MPTKPSGTSSNTGLQQVVTKRMWFLLVLLCIYVMIRSWSDGNDPLLQMTTSVEQRSLDSKQSVMHDYSGYDLEIEDTSITIQEPRQRSLNDRCAINFFGLPRAFESLVLPSIVKNIIAVNPDCDYYVHYYHMTKEGEGRSGAGGMIDPTAVLLLRNAVHQEARRHNGDDAIELPIVEFVFDQEEDFWKKYSDLIERIRTTKVNGKYLYFPWKELSYKHPETTDNIVKMWHTIQSSYELMESVAASKGIEYTMVGMFRLDVVYVTPIDIHDAPNPDPSDLNWVPPATITNFGNFPVSDRMIYGPRAAVQAWATQRFTQLESHVQYMLQHEPGYGMHSERFVYNTLFPLIQNITTIRPHPTICFFRARADETVWVSDCSNDNPSIAAPSIIHDLLPGNRTLHDVVQDAIGRPCAVKTPTQFSTFVLSLPCHKAVNVGNTSDVMVVTNES